MKPADRQKMCSNCNGRVAVESSECPYCAHEFPESSKNNSFKHQTLQDSLTSLYKPPYSAGKVSSSPYEAPQAPSMPASAAVAEEEPKEDAKGDFWALFALIVAGNLLTLGLLQFFFSEEGTLRLEWDSSYWYLYCLIALPLFYLGFKKAQAAK